MQHLAGVDVDGRHSRTVDLPAVTRGDLCTHRLVQTCRAIGAAQTLENCVRGEEVDVPERCRGGVDIAQIDDDLEDPAVFVVEMPPANGVVAVACLPDSPSRA